MYTYDIDPEAMFEDRTHQFEKFGVPLADIEMVRGRVTDMWADAPGGWVYEWSLLAQEYANRGEHYTASLVYGCAKFPCIADTARAVALEHQLDEFLLAASDFGVHFERRTINVPYRDGSAEVAVHLYSKDADISSRPVLIASGGVDTWKMDFHPWWMAFTTHADVTTLAFDHPGTGESSVPLDRFADDVIRGIASYASGLGDGRVAHFGASFGGNFSAMSGLTGVVDAAVDLGGPVSDAFGRANAARLPYGMHDILGNALHLDRSPSLDELTDGLAALDRRELRGLEQHSPMLVINGADDYFVPQSDTSVFEGRRHTDVQLIPGTGHCAMSKAPEVIPVIIGWLRTHLARPSAEMHVSAGNSQVEVAIS